MRGPGFETWILPLISHVALMNYRIPLEPQFPHFSGHKDNFYLSLLLWHSYTMLGKSNSQTISWKSMLEMKWDDRSVKDTLENARKKKGRGPHSSQGASRQTKGLLEALYKIWLVLRFQRSLGCGLVEGREGMEGVRCLWGRIISRIHSLNHSIHNVESLFSCWEPTIFNMC